jgi:hypothetical protein
MVATDRFEHVWSVVGFADGMVHVRNLWNDEELKMRPGIFCRTFTDFTCL